jgi:hypothetical protein
MTTRCPNCGTLLQLTIPEDRSEPVDLGVLLTVTGVQTARSAACALFGTDSPTPAQLERARRRLEDMVQWGAAVRRQGTQGVGRFPPVQYLPPHRHAST